MNRDTALGKLRTAKESLAAEPGMYGKLCGLLDARNVDWDSWALLGECDTPGDVIEYFKTKLPTAGTSDSDEVAVLLPQMAKQLQAVHAAMMAKLSATIQASKISPESMDEVHKAAGTVVVCAPENTADDLRTLIGQMTPDDESFWDQSVVEPAQRELYSAIIKDKSPVVSGFAWVKGEQVVKRGFGDMQKQIAAKNDEVLVAKRVASNTLAVRALIGIELKKRLTMLATRQTEAEFLLWSDASMFPFLQLVTDMERGGVAYYYTGHQAKSDGGRRAIAQRVLRNMDEVWQFLSSAISNLPKDIGRFAGNDMVWLEEASHPKRLKLDIQPAGGPAGGPVGQDARSLLARLLNNDDDVACMRDVMGGPEEFQLPWFPIDRPCLYIN